MTIEINEKDVNRALRVARMIAKCDCQEKGGSIDNHFATIICDNHDRMVEEIAELKRLAEMVANGGNEDPQGAVIHLRIHSREAKNLLAKLNQEGEE
ncbi:hypothetical protein VPHF27_0008 [Vibrio phage F27]|nr:putative coil containing protein [Vibrio phage 115E34-1]